MAAPSRPHVYFDWAPERSPWASPADIRRDGGVLVWPASETSRDAPTRLKAQFPELVPEVPHSFERPVQGFLPLLRLGWAVIRPARRALRGPQISVHRCQIGFAEPCPLRG